MLKYSQKLKPQQPLVLQLMFNHIQGGRYEKVEKDRYEDKEELTEHQIKIQQAKKRLQWRTPFVERTDFWYSKFSLFSNDKSDRASADTIDFLQTKFDFSWKGLKERRERKRVAKEIFLQQFIPERHQMLGNDLAAAHFICYRGGSIKFTKYENWYRADEKLEFPFPNKYDASYELEGIRCEDMELYYEGLENIRRLKKLKTLSFRNVKTFDDWCLDRVSGSQFPLLEILDISGTSITERGLCSLYRIPSLKILIVDNPKKSDSFEYCSVLLEDVIPLLKVVATTESSNSNTENKSI